MYLNYLPIYLSKSSQANDLTLMASYDYTFWVEGGESPANELHRDESVYL